MKNIQGVKLGNTLNLYLDGKLHKKTFSTKELADKVYRLVLDAKQNPTQDAIDLIIAYLNDATRIARQNGLEYDMDSGSVFLAGFNTPLPKLLIETIEEYHENEYPLKAIVNFWKLLMICPDVRVREDAFKFLQKHELSLTDYGYFIVYKAVDYLIKQDNDVAEFVTNQYLFVKKNWKCSANKYVVYKNLEDGIYAITKTETAAHWDAKTKNIEILGKLGDLNAQLDKLAEMSKTVYTDMYSHEMSIKLGMPVSQTRKNCNADPKKDCSDGLHVGSTSYVNSFGANADAILVCLINPANIIAVPTAEDCTKIRVCEYFPIALATYENGKIDIVEQKYFDSDYRAYEETELEKMIVSLQNDELPFGSARNAEPETRTMEELMKIVESRMMYIIES